MAMIYTEEQLNTVDKSLLIQLFLAEQEQSEKLSKQVDELNAKLSEMDEKMQHLLEQVILSNKARFGRSSEKMDDANQLCFTEVDGNIVFFNEAEAMADFDEPEPDDLEIKPRRGKKEVGKKKKDLQGLPVHRVDHYMTDEELTAEFGENGWKQLSDAISTRYLFTPAKIEVEEHHIGVYSSKKDNHMVKAKHPKTLLHGSLVSASLGAALMNAKYVNATPLARMEREMERYGLAISRKNMANWMIRLGEEYIAVMYDYLHKALYDYHVIQADETPVLVNRDGRPAGAHSYMWVYRSSIMQPERQIVLYEYQKTRNTSHPREFLKDFKGVCVTDGYQVYHTLDNEREDLIVAGCWVHCRRKFADALEVIPKDARKGTISYLVMKQIQAIYREENKLAGETPKVRLMQRQVVIKPLVDALFVYLKQHEHEVAKSSALHRAFVYALNQEKYLRVFLEDGEVPIDNNASERAIRGFCIGKKNWEVIDTINGAKTSAMIYSIAETAKANNLKPFEYFQHLLEVIPEHMEDTSTEFLKDLLPWSPNLPASIRKPLK